MSYKVMVTGAAGFIGSHVCRECLNLGMEVIGVDDLSGGKRENVPEGVQFIECDVSDQKAIENDYNELSARYYPRMYEVFEKYGPFDAVYHLSAYAAEIMSPHIAVFNYTNNLLSTVNLVNECVKQGQKTGKMPHFVFTSSIAVYGHAETLPVDEESPTRPADPYGAAKLCCEMHLETARRHFGLSYTVLRPYNVVGPRQNLSDPFRNVAGIFCRKALLGEPFPVFGDGKQTRAFSYVGDVARCIAIAPSVEKAQNETFNLGGETAISVGCLAQMIAEEFGIEPVIEYLPARNEVQHIYADSSKAYEVFGIKAPTPIEYTIKEMVAWAKTQSLTDPKPFAHVEVDWLMPPSWQKYLR